MNALVSARDSKSRSECNPEDSAQCADAPASAVGPVHLASHACIVQRSNYILIMHKVHFSDLLKRVSKAQSYSRWRWSVPPDQATHLQEHYEFGTNPGKLRMLSYQPDIISSHAPLVVVLHGCTQTAAAYDTGAGWSTLADHFGFSLLLPQQQRANNPNGCFNWFLPDDTRRGSGEVESISQMIDQLVRDGIADPDRVFVTGLSAGGAMAAAMLATYPEKFIAGAIIAGLPFGCADSVPSALQAMSHAQKKSGQTWGDLVRSASPNRGAWPRVAVWHGSADRTVAPSNGAALVAQWLDVHHLTDEKPEVDRADGHPRSTWRRGGDTIVEQYIVTGMAHGTPLNVNADDFPHGETGPFLLEAGIASSLHIARFFGIAVSSPGASKQKSRWSSSGENTSSASNRIDPVLTWQMPSNIMQVINKALRSAGLVA